MTRTQESLKQAIRVAHNNTHSTSRILRNVQLIRESQATSESIESRLISIETAARECRKQVDELYNIIKQQSEHN